eukprot:Em0001g1375a
MPKMSPHQKREIQAQVRTSVMGKRKYFLRFPRSSESHIATSSNQCCWMNGKAFVSAVKQHMPSLLNKQKTHLILHLVESMVKFGPCSSFSAERFASFNSNCGMQYDIVLGMFALSDKVLEHRSVVSQNTVLVSSGEFVELVISQCNMKYGILLATFKLNDGSVIAWCKAFMSSH